MVAPGISVAMRGARMHYAVPRILHRAGLLQALLTDVYLPDGRLRRLLAGGARLPGGARRLAPVLGRFHPDLEAAPIRDGRLHALLTRPITASGLRRAHRHRAKLHGARQLAELLRASRPPDGSAVFAFHGAALEVFRAARGGAHPCILEQSIALRGPVSELLARETQDWGHWFTDAGRPRLDRAGAARAAAERAMADLVVAPSAFVRDSLCAAGVPAERIRLVPYGVDLPPPVARDGAARGCRPLRLLFAGHADLRKGVHHLLRAVEDLAPRHVTLRIAGEIGLVPEIVTGHAGRVEFLGRLARGDMARQFQWADVLVLPSLLEGSATVTYEALAHGLPLIVTRNAGALMRDGREGQIVAAGATAPLRAAIERYLDEPDLLRAHTRAAADARHRVSFARYSDDLLAALEGVTA